ncbi:putative metallo-beta-lactamase superfamily protein [Actinocatenispora thailandica]|uniref:Putative metallo-beta-lactamase superfamily protein n=1 Tax=Actinocatenispora thailandica TaxID=227318 RepID=A0A7R7DSN3_9ACTN|nr:MBL fold metallo-hydrolase [Actinocatenispora thailandica]BCJ37059.1 putative metallo-beta-lactamase superfamily protein [Actinocatenispora thailandica]
MEIVELRPDLRMVVGAPGQAYLLRHSGGVLLVDTGRMGTGDAIAGALREWGLGRDAVTHLVLTHWHADHAGSAAEIAGWPNVRVFAHRADAPVVRGERAGAEAMLTPAERTLHAQVSDGLPDAPPARVDHELDDAQTLADLGAHVVATPGHTPGSIALHLPAAGVLFTGDIAAEHDGAVLLGPFNCDRELAKRSFRRLGELAADVVCFGHGRPLLGAATSALRLAATARTVPDPLG